MSNQMWGLVNIRRQKGANLTTNTTPRLLLSLIQWEPTSTASTSKQIKTSKQRLEWSRTIKHQSPDLDNTIATSVQSSLRLHLFHSNSLARQLKGLTRMMLPPWDQEFTNYHQTSRTANNLTKLLTRSTPRANATIHSLNSEPTSSIIFPVQEPTLKSLS